MKNLKRSPQSGVHFDLDGDFFAEASGWLQGDDGFIVMDRNGNGVIDDISEMFGGPDRSGFGDLAALDDNDDGFITVSDAGFAALRIWQDFDQDGATDAGELSTLTDNDIASLGTGKTDLNNFQTPQGTTLFAKGDYIRADGSVGKLYDAGFETNSTDTIFRGEKGIAAWLKGAGAAPDAKGFGSMTSLSVGQSNDFELQETVAAAASAMTVPTLRAIRAAATPVFGKWAKRKRPARRAGLKARCAGGARRSRNPP